MNRWTSKLFWTGHKRDLEISDLYEPLKEHVSGNILMIEYENS